MTQPPIDKLIQKADCRYALTCVVAKRARQIIGQEQEYLLDSGMKPVSLAAKEIYEGKVIIQKD
ncbi:MAG: DNA-directed RNA polymerase subunit omega [Clostridia bacterium]|nr:DNA-directed RNA polymerase subunit omega [Clostridia bacterium]